MSTGQFYALLATKGFTIAQKAIAILWWHDRENAGTEMTAEAITALVREHALGNPRVSFVDDAITKARVAIKSASGFRMRAESRDKVAMWFKGDALPDSAPSMPANEHSAAPIRKGVPTTAPTRATPAKVPRIASTRPRVFVGSSVEGLDVANGIQAGLEFDCESTVWTQGVFGLSRGTLESLVEAAQNSDFAVLALTADDVTTKRENTNASPRDNVIFELGLFMGALGRDRTFIVHARGQDLDLPSDLEGITTATFGERSDGNLQAALGPVCTKIRTAMKKTGLR
jgi:predicted nucleotide-binding protein